MNKEKIESLLKYVFKKKKKTLLITYWCVQSECAASVENMISVKLWNQVSLRLAKLPKSYSTSLEARNLFLIF